MSGGIDSHQHFWKYDPEQYPWIKPEWPIRRSFLPEDLEPLLKKAGFGGCIAVQARQSLAESRWLLELAESHSFIKGVVGWVDLRAKELESQLDEFSTHAKFVGVRHVVQDEPDDNFMLRDDFQEGIARLNDHGLTYDMLIFPRQLPAAVQLARRFPEQAFVLDHIAKPPIRDGSIAPWKTQLLELARSGNVYCKISGMVTEARWKDWKSIDFRPYLDVVWEAFGEDRLMVGSDWPVCLLSSEYSRTMSIAFDYLAQFSAETREKVLSRNAARFYGVPAQ